MVCSSSSCLVLISNIQPKVVNKRQVRSFIRRDGRLTVGQRNALDSGWTDFGLDITDQPLDLAAVFGNTAPVILEIGFGNGEALAIMAQNYPHYNFIGIETHKPGVGHLLIEVVRRGLDNVRVCNADVMSVLGYIENDSVSGIHIFFPDPWQKRRHHKRRLINTDFIQKISGKLCRSGYVFIATDWHDYAQSIQAVLSTEDCQLQEITQLAQTIFAIPERPITKFESRGLRLGHSIHEFRFFRQH